MPKKNKNVLGQIGNVAKKLYNNKLVRGLYKVAVPKPLRKSARVLAPVFREPKPRRVPPVVMNYEYKPAINDSSNGRSVTIQRREKIATLRGHASPGLFQYSMLTPSGPNNQTDGLLINPGNAMCFPMGSREALMHVKYRIKRLEFVYIPKSAATTLTTGTIYLMMLPNAQYPKPSDETEAGNLNGCVIGNLWSKWTYRVRTEDLSGQKERYVSSAVSVGLAANAFEQSMKSPGIFYIASAGLPSTFLDTVEYGDLYVNYQVELIDQVLSKNIIALGQSLESVILNATRAAPFGTDYKSSLGTQFIMRASGTAITSLLGCYRLDMVVDGTIFTTIPTVTLVGCSVKRVIHLIEGGSLKMFIQYIIHVTQTMNSMTFDFTPCCATLTDLVYQGSVYALESY